MYTFFLNMWKMNRIDEVYLQGQLNVGRITEEQYNTIISTTKIGG